MRCSDVIFAVLPTLAVGLSPLSKRDYWGPAFSSGPTSNGVTVRYAAMTLTPGRAPPNPRGDLFIWPGVGGDVDLLQVVFLTAENCNAPQGSWCAQPYVAGPRYINGPVAVVGPNDRIRIKYELQADGVHWIQSATNLATGKVITQLQSDSGDHQKGVGTAIECNQNCQPTVSDHTYVHWEVRLSKADPAFRNTFGVNQDATYEGVTSELNGQVWKISKIFIPKMA